MEFEKNFENLTFKHMDNLRNSIEQSLRQWMYFVHSYMHS